MNCEYSSKPLTTLLSVLQKDILYWGIDELTMEPCCALKYYPEVKDERK